MWFGFNNVVYPETFRFIIARMCGKQVIISVIPKKCIRVQNIGVPVIGAFESKSEAEGAFKYIKSKFARAMLGILKITQDNNRATWAEVPMQDFTKNSDIDWSRSIPEIDQQLYKKYDLSPDEINFIETKVQAMR